MSLLEHDKRMEGTRPHLQNIIFKQLSDNHHHMKCDHYRRESDAVNIGYMRRHFQLRMALCPIPIRPRTRTMCGIHPANRTLAPKYRLWLARLFCLLFCCSCTLCVCQKGKIDPKVKTHAIHLSA